MNKPGTEHILDFERAKRIGLGEAILAEPKSPAQLDAIIESSLRYLSQTTARSDALEVPDNQKGASEKPVGFLFTRMSPHKFTSLNETSKRNLRYNEVSQTALLGKAAPSRAGKVNIVAAGTSDLSVAYEASETLGFYGVSNQVLADVGVAGIWRLLERVDQIDDCDVIIAVAGMDAAIVSVLGGLVAAPIIATPTSVGYGAVDGGKTALAASLVSCAQGVSVVNIDNGFGAACSALRILNAIYRTEG